MTKTSGKHAVLVIGVGNPFRFDDGIGCEIIRILRLENLPNCDLLDGGTDGLSLLDAVAVYDRAVIVDAVHMGEKPGFVKVFTPEEAKIKIRQDVLSTHGFGLAEMLKLAEQLNVKTKITIIGVEPKDVGFGDGLSAEIRGQITHILSLVKQEISDLL